MAEDGRGRDDRGVVTRDSKPGTTHESPYLCQSIAMAGISFVWLWLKQVLGNDCGFPIPTLHCNQLLMHTHLCNWKYTVGDGVLSF